MGKGIESPQERAARRVVERIDDVQLKFRDDVNAPPGTHDYDVLRSSKVVGALEVTTLMDESRQKLSQTIIRRSVIPAPELSRDWYINLKHDEEGYSVRDVEARIVPSISELEQRGLDTFDARPWRLRDAEPLAIEQLPVRSAMSFERQGEGGEVPPARVVLMPPGIAGMVSSENTHTAIQTALNGKRLESDRTKLMRSGLSERHLFLWIDITEWEAYVGLVDVEEPMPQDVLALPAEVSILWAAAPSSQGFVVWRAAGSAWERF